MPPEPGVTEIRVHGVGGASPDMILERSGYSQVTGDDTAGFYRARDEEGRVLEAYSWGGLTARSASRALWVLLLPFSLVNLAGWMIEPSAPSAASKEETPANFPRLRRRISRFNAQIQQSLLHTQEWSIHVVAITLTALYVMWVALLSVNLLAYQCAGQGACRKDRWWLEFLGRGFFENAPGRRIVLGSLVPLGLLGLFVLLGRLSRSRYDVDRERRATAIDDLEASATPQELNVTDPSFWNQSDWQRRVGRLHISQALLAFSAVLSWASWQFAAKVDFSGRETWGPIPVAVAVLLGLITLGVLYWVVASSGLNAQRADGVTRWLMWLSVALTVLSLGVAWGLQASDSALADEKARDLWGFGWAPILLLGWVAVWLVVFSVAQLFRWFAARQERWHQLYVVALGLVIVLWRYAYWVVAGTALFAIFSLIRDWRDQQGDGKQPDSPPDSPPPDDARSTPEDESDGKQPDSGSDSPPPDDARSTREDLPATIAIILISLAAVPIRWWSGEQSGLWGVEWPRLTPTLLAIVVVLILGSVLPRYPEPRWLDTAAAAVILLVGVALEAITDNDAWVWMAAMVAYVALAVRWLTRLQVPYFRWNGGAAVAAFSVILLSGIMAGALLRFIDLLDRAGEVESLGTVKLKSTDVLGWFSVGFTIILLAVVIGWLIAFLGYALTEGRSAGDDEKKRLREVDEKHRLREEEINRLGKGVAKWTSASRAVRAADVPITLISLTAALALTAGVVALLQSGVGLSKWLDQPLPREWSPLVAICSLIGVGTVIGGYLLVRSALRSRTARQRLGIAWDVASFWPRRFHPLAPPAYAARGVPELRARIMEATERDGRVVLSCHSQGSVIGLVAVSSLPSENARRTALITHGSPLSTFYRPFFPRFFTESMLKNTATNLGPIDQPDDGGWVNFYRDTDPIGNPVFEPVGEAETLPRKLAKGLAGRWGPPLPDVRLRDPWRTTLVAQQPPPTLLIHSSYANDPIMARAVAAAVERLEEQAGAVDQVVLVDGEDKAYGPASRRSAHSGLGQLHRAFSVFIFDQQGRLLMQKRAASKLPFAGLWANTCCSHPRPEETVLEAAQRRLWEEMRLSVDLEVFGSFEYRAEDPESGLVEHEFDHVLVGTTTDDPDPNANEVADWEWVDFAVVRERALSGDPTCAPWLAAAFAALPDLDATAPNPR